MKKVLVLLAAAAFVFAFTAPAFSADWSFYGSSRMNTQWLDRDKENSGVNFDDTDLGWFLQGNTRIGARVKAGDISGQFEYGHGATVNTRIIWGEWDFGAGKMGIGQTYTPANFFISNQIFGGDSDMLPYGGIYDGRRPMIRFTFGAFQIALVQPNANITLAGAGDTDTTIPKLEARWNHSFGPVFVELGGLYNTYDEVNIVTDQEISVDSYLLYGGFKYSMGAFYFNGDIWIGQNLGNTTFWTIGASAATLDATGNDVDDTDNFGWLAVIGYKASDMIQLEGGYGMAEHEPDFAGADKDDLAAWYVQATINLAKGVFVVPEFGQIDFKDNAAGVDQGKQTYLAAKWQINF